MKTCSRCRENKDDTDFYKNSTHIDGLSYWCKTCQYSQIKKSVKPGYVSTYNRHKQNHTNRKGIKIGARTKNADRSEYVEYFTPLKETVDKKWDKMLNKLKENGKVRT